MASWEFCKHTHQFFMKYPISSKRCSSLLFFALSFSFPLPLLVAKKHDFFDSGLLYKFYVNFRRRRRLSELLNEGDQDDDQGVVVSTQEDNHPDSPFVLRKGRPREGNGAFQSGKKKKKNNNSALLCLNTLLGILIIA